MSSAAADRRSTRPTRSRGFTDHRLSGDEGQAGVCFFGPRLCNTDEPGQLAAPSLNHAVGYRVVNGADSLLGHIYQQNFVLYRLLSSIYAREIVDDDAPFIEVLRIESQSNEDGPTWDASFVLHDDSVYLFECKNTAIKGCHRRDFYRRIRKELATGTRPLSWCMPDGSPIRKSSQAICYGISPK